MNAWWILLLFLLIAGTIITLYVVASMNASTGLRWGGFAAVVVAVIGVGIIMWFWARCMNKSCVGSTIAEHALHADEHPRSADYIRDQAAHIAVLQAELKDCVSDNATNRHAAAVCEQEVAALAHSRAELAVEDARLLEESTAHTPRREYLVTQVPSKSPVRWSIE